MTILLVRHDETDGNRVFCNAPTCNAHVAIAGTHVFGLSCADSRAMLSYM